MRCRCCGRFNKKNGSFDLTRSDRGVVIRQPTFLLNLHSLSRRKDTSSVRFASTFTPELRPSDALGVQAPLRGRLAGRLQLPNLSTNPTANGNQRNFLAPTTLRAVIRWATLPFSVLLLGQRSIFLRRRCRFFPNLSTVSTANGNKWDFSPPSQKFPHKKRRAERSK